MDAKIQKPLRIFIFCILSLNLSFLLPLFFGSWYPGSWFLVLFFACSVLGIWQKHLS
jgi:hypothetical protein